MTHIVTRRDTCVRVRSCIPLLHGFHYDSRYVSVQSQFCLALRTRGLASRFSTVFAHSGSLIMPNWHILSPFILFNFAAHILSCDSLSLSLMRERAYNGVFCKNLRAFFHVVPSCCFATCCFLANNSRALLEGAAWLNLHHFALLEELRCVIANYLSISQWN